MLLTHIQKRSLFYLGFISLIVSITYRTSLAQTPQKEKSVAAYVLLDSVVVQPGLDIQYFIDLMKDDQSLYRSFASLRTVPYTASYNMQFLDKKGVAQASLIAKGVQDCDSKCCEHRLKRSWGFGNLMTKSGDYNYYTAVLFHRLFLKEDSYCNQNIDDIEELNISDEEQTHVRYLKQLIFQPGVALDIPVFGHQTDIFSKDHFKKYKFFFSERSMDSERYYVFNAVLRQDETLPIQYLETWFSKEDRQIVKRNFHIKTSNWIYKADVIMNIELQPLDNRYIPREISYFGRWDIPGSKEENGNFKILINPIKDD